VEHVVHGGIKFFCDIFTVKHVSSTTVLMLLNVFYENQIKKDNLRDVGIEDDNIKINLNGVMPKVVRIYVDHDRVQ
jgi:hypothetical protein